MAGRDETADQSTFSGPGCASRPGGRAEFHADAALRQSRQGKPYLAEFVCSQLDQRLAARRACWAWQRRDCLDRSTWRTQTIHEKHETTLRRIGGLMGIVKKIGYAAFETSDVHRLSEYYQDVLGFAVQAQARDMVFLSCPLDHHSVVLKKGPRSDCTELGLEVPSDDGLSELLRRIASHGITVSEANDPEPSIALRIIFAGPGNFTIDAEAEAVVVEQ